MGRTSPVKRDKDGRKTRKRDFTEDDLRKLVKKIRELAAEIDALAVEVHQRGPEKFGVDGAGKADDATTLLKQFIGKVKSGIDNAIAGP